MGFTVKEFIRFAVYFKGDAYQLETTKKDPKTGTLITRTAYRHGVKYGEWCAASEHPLAEYSKVCKGASRVEIHTKGSDGKIVLRHTIKDPEKEQVKIEWLVLSPFAPGEDKGKLAVYIRGLRISSKNEPSQEFIVLEGV